MMSPSIPSISESDLHAYVDDALSDVRRHEVAQWLAEHPEDLLRVQAYQSQNAGIHQIMDDVLDEPIPLRLQEQLSAQKLSVQSQRSFLSYWSLQRIAAGILFAVICGAGGGLAGWNLHATQNTTLAINEQGHSAGNQADNQTDSLPHRAAIAHVVYTPDVKRPVEVGSDQEEQLVKWLSKRLGSPLKPPKLSAKGYDLVGGRLLPGSSGPVAQFMYQNASGLRLTLYASNENKSNKDTGFRYLKEGQVSVFYWIDGQFGYALSGNIDKDSLSQLSMLVFEQLQPGSVPIPPETQAR